MKISWNWLNEWIDLDGMDVEELGSRLTMAGLEVEAIERIGATNDDIVVAEILSIEAHPKADRLVVCSVNDGTPTPRQVVCGAKNMSAGDRVPLALPGSQPPALDFEIVERKVMGVVSSGMLCAEEELGLAKQSDGLMILPADLPLGHPVFDALGFKDLVLHIGLTPNRADCLSHLGVAREVAALYGRSLRAERLATPEPVWDSGQKPITDLATLEIVDSQGCPQYAMAVLEDVEVGPSPLWLRRRLHSVGVRSINNVVDVTNFVLMDVGQPLHAFDLDALDGAKIIVRRARAGEKLLGIDHREYALTPEDLVIADRSRPLALAGVMGGADSEVGEKTRRILLECAYFDPRTVRRSARRHGLHTESSHRFERGIDPGAIGENIQRAIAGLLRAHEHVSGADVKLARGITWDHADAISPTTIRLERTMTNRILGTALSDEEVAGLLQALGLTVETTDSEALQVMVPPFRSDLERPIDLVEEVARLYGYEKIPTTLPTGTMGHEHRRRTSQEGPTIMSSSDRTLLRDMRRDLLGFGLYEAVNYSFMASEDLDALGLPQDDSRRNAPIVANPLVKSQGLMRTTMVPSLLQNLATNLARRRQDVALFEFGRRYTREGERRTLAILLKGKKVQHWSANQPWDFFDLKGIVEVLATPFDLAAGRWVVPADLEPYLHPGVQARWVFRDQIIATIGQLHPAQAQQRDIDGAVFLAEVDLDALLSVSRKQGRYSPLPKFPGVARDFALLYDRQAPYGDLREGIDQIVAAAPELSSILESVELFDVYEGAQVPQGKRSLALSLVYRSSERTLTDEDVERADRILLEGLERKVGATLR
jgi:phenylalanyl-tRNA synthetase beta chain